MLNAALGPHLALVTTVSVPREPGVIVPIVVAARFETVLFARLHALMVPAMFVMPRKSAILAMPCTVWGVVVVSIVRAPLGMGQESEQVVQPVRVG